MNNLHLEHRHERNPIFLAAATFYGAVVRISLPHGLRAQRSKLERVASKMALAIAEAIDRPALRSARLAIADDCSANAAAILRLLRSGGLIEAAAHDQLLQLLRAASIDVQQAADVTPPQSDAGVEDEEPEASQGPAAPTSGPRNESSSDVTAPDADGSAIAHEATSGGAPVASGSADVELADGDVGAAPLVPDLDP